MSDLVRNGVTTCRIWATSHGRLVLDGHPDAALLRYGPGDQVHPDDHGKLAALTTEQPHAKQADPPPNKQAKPPANKSGSGLAVNRLPRGGTA